MARAGWAMHAEEVGNPDGPPLLLIHGFLSSNAQWDLNRDRLGRTFRLVMVELMGHGRSDTPDDREAYGPRHVLTELERIREHLGIHRWWACGQSLGGAIATRYCLAHPERARGLIFTNTRAAFGIGRPGVTADQSRPLAEITSTREIRVHPIYATRLPGHVRARLIAAADTTPLHVTRHATSHRDSWRSVDQMPNLEVPVMLVNGRWESAFQASLEEARAAITNIEIVDLEGGHAINIEQADAFNHAVLTFVDRHGSGA